MKGGGNSTFYLGEGFAWGIRSRGKLCRLTIKWTLSKTFAKDFPYTLRVPSTNCFKSIASHKNTYFSRISFYLDHFSLLWDTTLLYFFIWDFVCFEQNEPIKVQIFRLETPRMKINQIPYVVFQTTSQFFFKCCITI